MPFSSTVGAHDTLVLLLLQFLSLALSVCIQNQCSISLHHVLIDEAVFILLQHRLDHDILVEISPWLTTCLLNMLHHILNIQSHHIRGFVLHTLYLHDMPNYTPWSRSVLSLSVVDCYSNGRLPLFFERDQTVLSPNRFISLPFTFHNDCTTRCSAHSHPVFVKPSKNSTPYLQPGEEGHQYRPQTSGHWKRPPRLRITRGRVHTTISSSDRRFRGMCCPLYRFGIISRTSPKFVHLKNAIENCQN